MGKGPVQIKGKLDIDFSRLAYSISPVNRIIHLKK